MSKTSLADLRAVTAYFPNGNYKPTRPATTQDLIEAVKSIGGEVRKTTQSPRLANPWIPVLEPGRYLILRLEDSDE